MRILIVDDDNLVLSSLRRLLQRDGRVTELATCGSAALSILESSQFDVILCDYSMPEISGFELFQSLRRIGVRTPFILMSGYESKDIPHAVDNGLSVLTKPCSRDELLSSITHAIQSAASAH